MWEPVLVMTLCASSAEADAIAARLLEERLVACVNVVGGAQSFFRWKGESCREAEWLLLMKTRRDLFEPLRRRIRELHSYELPEIIAVPILEADPEYRHWIGESTTGGP